jgi:NNP family nitrate/nitrite transporter-like MFS transporter
MRGRIWWLWGCQTTAGVLCVGLGLANNSFAHTLVVLCFFSFFVEGAAGALFSIVPFVSKRSLGLVCGFVGAGGNTGSAITQAIFFTPGSIAPYNSFKYMGFMIIGISLTHFLTYFPMWGGMLCPAKKSFTEEDYYFGEWTPAERDNGEHLAVMKFANESKSQRGMLRLKAEAQAAQTADAKVVPQTV